MKLTNQEKKEFAFTVRPILLFLFGPTYTMDPYAYDFVGIENISIQLDRRWFTEKGDGPYRFKIHKNHKDTTPEEVYKVLLSHLSEILERNEIGKHNEENWTSYKEKDVQSFIETLQKKIGG